MNSASFLLSFLFFITQSFVTWSLVQPALLRPSSCLFAVFLCSELIVVEKVTGLAPRVAHRNLVHFPSALELACANIEGCLARVALRGRGSISLHFCQQGLFHRHLTGQVSMPPHILGVNQNART